MLDAKLWRKQCFCCMWANKSAVEIEFKFGKVKRYRKETFCYGPRSCPLYDMGPPRPVQYFDTCPSMDDGWMDELCTELRREDDQAGDSPPLRSRQSSLGEAPALMVGIVVPEDDLYRDRGACDQPCVELRGSCSR
jgi:hypothetical protein